MPRNLISFIQVLKYIINPKSTSLSSSLKPSPPKVRLDSVLVSFGLLSGEYENDGSIKDTKYGKYNQIFIISYLGYYTLKIFLSMIIADNSVLLIYIGDPALIWMKMCRRIYFHAFYIALTLKAFLVLLYYYFNRNSGKLCWLRITQLSKGLKIIYSIIFNNFFCNKEFTTKIILQFIK